MVPLPGEAQTREAVVTAPDDDRRRAADRSSRGHRSSHDDAAGVEFAGWMRGRPGRFRELLPERHPHVSWLRPSVLWATRNDKLAEWLADPTDPERRRWVARQRERGVSPDLVLRDHAGHDAISFLVLGDTGEGDASQYGRGPAACSAAGEGTRFAVICQRRDLPERRRERVPGQVLPPIPGLPRADLRRCRATTTGTTTSTGFMFHFCGADRAAAARAGPGAAGVAAPRALATSRDASSRP